MKRIAAVVSLLLMLGGCESGTKFHFDDPVYIRIAELQDHAANDSLYYYLTSSNPGYRSAAALAFASVQDSAAAPALGSRLLEDKDSLVRKNAAYALGQTSSIASVNALIPALRESSPSVVREILEALGKTARKDDADALRNYTPKDSLGEEGKARGIYRLALRGISNDKDIRIETAFLAANFSAQTRIAAASFFGRSPLKTPGFATSLIRAAQSDPLAEVRMGAVAGLKKLPADTALPVLIKVLSEEKDYRVRINAVRALAPMPIDKTMPLFLKSLSDPNVNVGITATEVLSNIDNVPVSELTKALQQAKNWRIKTNLYTLVYKLAPTPELLEQIKQVYSFSSNVYEKAWILGALKTNPEEVNFVQKILLSSSVPVLKTSAAEVLIGMNTAKSFKPSQKPVFAEVYQKAIADGDPAVIGYVCSALADSALGYRQVFKDLSFLYTARAKLKMPKDVESIQSLNEAIATLEGKKKPEPPKGEWNHAIDWNAVKAIRNHPRVLVKTSKGDITMRLLEQQSPGSAANFVSLVEQHYFDGRFFHRTVPNFVIQTGCKRGDGSGSEDYAIRSEFSDLRYTTGSVGMASAGKNTEGTQWFITHSPTPHLDGRYSIFAQVESGMEVVHQMEVGDRILSATLLPN